jgi:polyisoprenoid-binding protein YceI
MTPNESGPQQSSDIAALVRDGTLTGRWRLDPAASRVEFGVPHFWHAITVRGWFERFEGDGTVGEDGAVSGRLSIDAVSLNTKNKRRDKHLRSADFFDVERHPQVVVTVERATASDGRQVAMAGTLEAAGIKQPITFAGEITESSADAVTMRLGLVVDRTLFGMTWRPLKMTAKEATATVTARFTRAINQES